ncbi:MAG: hypothetical protein VX619_05115 [bacterium]|nr:hypothetical protein [bacterium]
MNFSDRTSMRLPIAVTPLNLILIALMIIAPQLGKLAREIVDEKKNEKSLDIVISRRAVPKNKIRKKKTDRQRKKTMSRLAMLEKAERRKINSTVDTSENKHKAPVHSSPPGMDQGKALLNKMKSERIISKPKARHLIPNMDKKSFINQLKDFARNRNYDEAEKIFMSRLENMQLAPLESLEKQSKFRDHFSRLVQQLESKSSEN